jgi:hypothetical protein
MLHANQPDEKEKPTSPSTNPNTTKTTTFTKKPQPLYQKNICPAPISSSLSQFVKKFYLANP